MFTHDWINESFINYKYNTYYKYWLIQNLNLDCDINNTIMNIPRWYGREFRIPELHEFRKLYSHKYCISDEGVVFENTSGYIGGLQHHHKNKEVLLYVDKGKITKVEFFYANDHEHEYTIKFDKSEISNISIVKQDFQMIKLNGHTCASTIDPVFLVKY